MPENTEVTLPADVLVYMRCVHCGERAYLPARRPVSSMSALRRYPDTPRPECDQHEWERDDV